MKVDEKTRERLFFIAPSMPQIGIIFESNDFEIVSSVEHENNLFLGVPYVYNENSKYKEYIVKSIKKDQVKEIFTISESNDPDTVQDDFQDFDFQRFEKISDKTWKKFEITENIFGNYENARDFVEALTICIIPTLGPVSEKDYDNAVNLIYKYFVF